MSPIGRATPTSTSRTPDSGVLRVASEGRASRAVAQALGALVERLIALGPERSRELEAPAGSTSSAQTGTDQPDAELLAARETLRLLVARSRDGVMLCRVLNGTLILEGAPVDRSDPVLVLLLQRLEALDVGSLTVREGAAPGELLTLARLLAQPNDAPSAPITADASRSTSIGGNTPPTVPAVESSSAHAKDAHAELLRTWSVLVTPVARERERESEAPPTGTAFARLTAARTDDAVAGAVSALRELLDEAQQRGDATVVEGIARACMTRLQVTGESGGRLALETLLRRLQRPPILDLLARQLPSSSDRPSLLQVFARAGDAGVNVLVHHLMTTDDSLERRAYFDGIIAMDVGSALLFDALRDHRWFVVRNTAALLGEMGAEHADEELIALLRHADERLRVAAARAMMRLRTVKSLQALHSTIDDPNPEVRRLSAAAFGLAGAIVGGGVRPPAARLAAALERETDVDVALEMLAALGRLGSADAVQRLIRMAMPATTDTSGVANGETRDSWIRIAALEALVRARGSQMQGLIDTLANDADPEVAAAAVALRSAGTA